MSDETKTPEELRALLAKAHPGPWRQGAAETDTVFVPGYCEYIGGERVLLRTNSNYPGEDDIALVVAAVNALPGLLDRIAELEVVGKKARSLVAAADACDREAERNHPSSRSSAPLNRYINAMAALRAALEEQGR